MNNKLRKYEYQSLIRALDYQFNDLSLLLTALTHKSMNDKEPLGEHGFNNERMEFLGDAVLSLIAANYLYHQNKESQCFLKKWKTHRRLRHQKKEPCITKMC